MKKLVNKTAIVTGGSKGIGKATAIKFLEDGANVAIWDVDEINGNELVNTLSEQFNGKIIFNKVDVTNRDSIQNAFEEVLTKFEKVDALINNAGITKDSTLKKMTPEQWQSVIDINLTGVFNCTQIISAHMVANNYGRIINASSVVGLYGNFGQTNYVATKAGVIGMTKVWARELGRKGITVNSISPGFIATEMVKAMPEKVIDMMKDKTPVGRLGTPEDIANAYAFLASDDASFINGTNLSVDGGIVI